MLLTIPVCGYFEVNCYLYADDVSRHGFLIDPGAEPQKLLAVIAAKKLVIDHILLTHGHFGHVDGRSRHPAQNPCCPHPHGRRRAPVRGR